MDEALSRREHEEYAKRMDEAHERFASRLKKLENTSEENTKLLVAIERLATNMESMQEEVNRQGERLGKLEAQDGEMWRKVIGHIATAAVGAVLCFIFTQIGM